MYIVHFIFLLQPALDALNSPMDVFCLFSAHIGPPSTTTSHFSCANPRTLLVNLLEDIPDTWPILVVSTWETKSDDGEATGPLGLDAGGAEAYGYRAVSYTHLTLPTKA